MRITVSREALVNAVWGAIFAGVLLAVGLGTHQAMAARDARCVRLYGRARTFQDSLGVATATRNDCRLP